MHERKSIVVHEIIDQKIKRWAPHGTVLGTLQRCVDGEYPFDVATGAKREIDVLIPAARFGSHGWGPADERELVAISTSLQRLLAEEPDVSFDWMIAINGNESDVERAEEILMDNPWTYLEVVDRTDREASGDTAAGTDFNIEASPDEAWLAVERLQAAGILAFLLDYEGDDVESFQAALNIEEGEDVEEEDDDNEDEDEEDLDDEEDEDDEEEDEDEEDEEEEDEDDEDDDEDEDEDLDDDDDEEEEDDDSDEELLEPWDGTEK